MLKNNFDILRLIFALLVFWAHRSLIWNEGGAPLGGWQTGLFAVRCFFVISGFLIFQSFDRTPSLRGYFEKRARRIAPAYVALIALACGVGAFISTVPPHQYFGIDLLKFIGAHLSLLQFLHPTLPGVFAGQGDGGAVNGALWTIRVEVMFYFSVPVIAWLSRGHRAAIFAIIYVASTAWLWRFSAQPDDGWIAKELPGALAFFISGGAIYYYFDAFKRAAWWLVPTACLILPLQLFAPLPFQFNPLMPAALAVCVIALALLSPVTVSMTRIGDLSYGLYLIHMPVLQTIVSTGVFADNPWAAYGLALLISLTLAFVSWHVIEQPWLRPKTRIAGAIAASTSEAA